MMTALDPPKDPRGRSTAGFFRSLEEPVEQAAPQAPTSNFPSPEEILEGRPSAFDEGGPALIRMRGGTGGLSYWEAERLQAEAGLTSPEQLSLSEVVGDIGRGAEMTTVRVAEGFTQNIIDITKSVFGKLGADLPDLTARELLFRYQGYVSDPLSVFNKPWEERIAEAKERAERYTKWEESYLKEHPVTEQAVKTGGVTGQVAGFVAGPGALAGLFGRGALALAKTAPKVSQILATSRLADKAAKVLASSAGFAGLYAVEDREILDGALMGAAFSFIGALGNRVQGAIGGVPGRAAAGFLEGSTLLPFASALEGDPSFINFVKAVASGNTEQIKLTYADFLRSGVAFAIFKTLAPAMAQRHHVQEAPGWVLKSTERGHTLTKGKEQLDVVVEEGGEISVKGNQAVAKRMGIKGKKGVLLQGEKAEDALREAFKASAIEEIKGRIPERELPREEREALPPELVEGAEAVSEWLRGPDVAVAVRPELVGVAEMAVEMAMKGGDPTGDTLALLMEPGFRQAAASARSSEEITNVVDQLVKTASGVSTAEQAIQALQGRPDVRPAELELSEREQAELRKWRESQEAEEAVGETAEERSARRYKSDRLKTPEELLGSVKEFIEEALGPKGFTSVEEAIAARERETAVRDLISETAKPGTKVSEVDAKAVFSGLPVPETLVQPARGVLRFWSEPLLDKVKRQNDVGGEMERLGRHQLDKVRDLRGEVSEELGAFEKAQRIGAVPAELNNLIPIHPEAYGMAGQMAADKQGSVKLSPAAEKVVDQYHQLQLKTGKWFENAGAQIKVGEDWIPFTVDPNRWRFIRSHTMDAYDLFEQATSPARDVLTRVLSDLNGITITESKAGLDAMKERGLFRRDAAETERVFKIFPAAIKVGGEIIPMLETGFATAGRRLVEKASMRASFIEQFGQDVGASGDISSSSWVERFHKAGGEPQDAINLLRAHNSIPLETAPKFLKVGSPAHASYRWFKMLDGLRRTGLLTRAFIPNIPEPLGNIPAFIGARRLAQAYGRILASGAKGEAGDLWREHHRLGATTKEVASWVWRKGRTLEDINRMVRQLNVPLKFVSEINDHVATEAARIMVEDLKAGNTTVVDRIRLELLKFSPEEVNDLMAGKASEELYNSVVSRAPAFTQFMDQIGGEVSRARASRVWNTLFFAEMFAQGKFRRMAEVTMKLKETSDAWMADPSKENFQRMAGMGQIAGEFFFGSALSGALSIYGKAFLTFGIIGLVDTEISLGETFSYALFGGVFSALQRVFEGIEGEEAPVQKIAEIATPVSLAMELYNVTTGQGAYRDRSITEAPLDAASIFLDRNLAISRNAKSGIASLGLGAVDREMDMALSKYYTWRRKNAPIQFGTGKQDEASRHFRRNMRKVTDLIKDGVSVTDDSVRELLQEAVQARGSLKSVGSSLLSRRILSGQSWSELDSEQREEVEEHLGPELMLKLRRYDALLEALAGAFK